VISEFQTHGFSFALQVFNSSAVFLETLTGLDKLKEATLEFEAGIMELDDDEDI